MKRAAIVTLAIAALVLLGSPSAPLLTDSSCQAATSNTSADAAVISPAGGGTVDTGGSSGSGGSGGTNRGDADGLSGLGGKWIVEVEAAPNVAVDRVLILIGTWWRFMIGIR